MMPPGEKNGDGPESREEYVRRLLDSRQDKKWENFSWLTLRALMSSVNDWIGRAAPRLVADLRGRWVSGQRTAESGGAWDADWIVRRPDANVFLIVGDPGEQDASQYVLVPELRGHEAADFMLICSDVIYPSGDVNDYVDGFYIPYRDLHLPIFAIPGNHDWYDGLSGFMWHFCGAEALANTSYIATTYSPLERLLLRLWRRPSRPHVDSLTAYREQRARNEGRKGWRAQQPGPYFAIETPRLMLICIDTGIVGEIDREQGEWLLSISQAEKDKVLVTGKPLVADMEHQPCAIRGCAPHDEPLRASPEGRPFHTVDDIIRWPEHRYVAAIGGDIHNYQRYSVDIDEGGKKRPFHYLVSGGGGAYMSATHPISQEGIEFKKDQDQAQKAIHFDPTNGFDSYPSRRASLRRYGRRLVPAVWRIFRALLAAFLGVGVAAAYVLLIDDTTTQHTALHGLLAILGIWLSFMGTGIPGRKKAGDTLVRDTRAYRAAIVFIAAVFGATLGLIGWSVAPTQFETNLAAAGVLVVGGIIVAWVIQRTGWWRTRDPDPTKQRSVARQAVANLAWLGVAAVATRIAADNGEVALAWLAAVVGVVGTGGWIMRASGRWSRGVAAGFIYGLQFVVALVVLYRWPLRESGREEFEAIVAVLLLPLLLIGMNVGLKWLGGRLAGRATRRLPPEAKPIEAILVAGGVLISAAAVYAVLRWIDWSPDVAVAVSAALGVLLVPAGIIALLDYARRVSPRFYAVWSLVTVGALALGLLKLGAFKDGSVFPELLGAVAAIAGIVILGVAAAHLTFLKAYTLAFSDSRTRMGLLELEEAKEAIAWRAGGQEPEGKRVRRIANIVHPGPLNPAGPLHRFVSEIFDFDQPPFHKNFLRLEVDDDELTIKCICVDEWDGSAASGFKKPEAIKVKLSDA